MFDANIRYYAYANLNGDKKHIGLFGNKSFWTKQLNLWNKEEGKKRRYTVEEWEELSPRKDLRGYVLSLVEPMDDMFLVTWYKGDDEFCVLIDAKNQPKWQCNPKNLSEFPQWLKPLRRQLKATKL